MAESQKPKEDDERRDAVLRRMLATPKAAKDSKGSSSKLAASKHIDARKTAQSK